MVDEPSLAQSSLIQQFMHIGVFVNELLDWEELSPVSVTMVNFDNNWFFCIEISIVCVKHRGILIY